MYGKDVRAGWGVWDGWWLSPTTGGRSRLGLYVLGLGLWALGHTAILVAASGVASLGAQWGGQAGEKPDV